MLKASFPFRVPLIVLPLTAASLASAQMHSMAQADANGNRQDTGFLSGSSASAVGNFNSSTGYGLAKASAEEGKLHAFAEASAKGPAEGAAANTVCVTASSAFFDTIHVGGTTGQTTTITLGLRLDGILSGSGASAYALFSAGDFATADITASSSGAFDKAKTISFEAPENSDFDIAGLLNASATADATFLTGDAFAQSDFGNTAHFYISSSDPSATVLGLSGYRYAQPVPEPASMAVLGLGVLGLARRRRATLGARKVR